MYGIRGVSKNIRQVFIYGLPRVGSLPASAHLLAHLDKNFGGFVEPFFGQPLHDIGKSFDGPTLSQAVDLDEVAVFDLQGKPSTGFENRDLVPGVGNGAYDAHGVKDRFSLRNKC